MSDYLQHYGTPRHSGRYPWGSGKNPYQGDQDFYSKYQELHKQGMSDSKIAKYFRDNVPGFEHFTSNDLMAKKSIANARIKAENKKRVFDLKEHGCSNMEIQRQTGIKEQTIRSWLKEGENDQNTRLQNTANILKKNVDSKGFIDIGPGVEYELGVTGTNLKVATKILEEEGYVKETVYVRPVNAKGPNKTSITVLAPPGTSWVDIQKNIDKVRTITDYSPDGGETFSSTEYPSSVSSDRIKVRYAEDGGISKDGVIELRRGVKDISLGSSNYAQVRIAVDGTHYLKGMAMYSDDMPKGVDIIFNTNKKRGTPMMSDDPNASQVLKPLKDDKDMPFGAEIKRNGQSYYADPNGEYVKVKKDKEDVYRKATPKDSDVEHYSLSAINKLQEEGDWEKWSKTLSSQFLSKQKYPLIKTQLDYTYADAKNDFDEIMRLNNPVIKQKLLESYADDCDSSAVDLKAAALPRQSSKVILPITSLPENQVYAPTYKQGEKVVLVRYPHGGTFEIPELIVNNKHAESRRILGNVKDAIGINEKVAERLSGADFDGDFVVVIPVNNRVRVTTTEPLEQLKDFNPKLSYPGYEGMPKMASKTKQNEMGKVSNLITDMTIKGASNDEIARAVRHSMVVIDAEKHNLNYKQSAIDNRIAELKTIYQGGPNAGASTLISKASSNKKVPERKYNWKPDPETGELTYEETGRTYIERKKDPKTGEYKESKPKLAMEDTTWMADTKDARTLSSGTIQEEVYASYANKMKALANRCRKESMKIKTEPVNATAKETYKLEVKSLNDKLRTALLNKPRERQAQILANKTISTKLAKNPELQYDKDKLKKMKNKALADARARVGAGKTLVSITDKEWDAIQNRAISTTTLRKILDNTDMDLLKQRATPRSETKVSENIKARIKAMSSSGLFTIAEIAEMTGVSSSTVSKYMAGK